MQVNDRSLAGCYYSFSFARTFCVAAGLIFCVYGCLPTREPIRPKGDYSFDDLGETTLIQTLPQPLSKVAKYESMLLAASKDRKQVYLLPLEGEGLQEIGSFGRGEGQYENVTDIGFVPGGQSVFVLDQANQRLNFFTLEGELEKSIPFGFAGYARYQTTIFRALVLDEDMLLIGSANQLRPLQIHRVGMGGQYVSSFFRIPERYYSMNLDSFSVPIVRYKEGVLFLGLKVSHEIKQMTSSGELISEIISRPAFYSPPTTKDRTWNPDGEEFWRWFRAWNTLVDVIPFEGGVARVFLLHEEPRYGVDFVSPEGRHLSRLIGTEMTPFEIESRKVYLFKGRSVYRASLGDLS